MSICSSHAITALIETLCSTHAFHHAQRRIPIGFGMVLGVVEMRAASAHSASATATSTAPRFIQSPSLLLDAGIRFIRPLQLNGVTTHLLGLPRADVADLPVHVVIPTLARNRIGDRFAQFVRTGGR